MSKNKSLLLVITFFIGIQSTLSSQTPPNSSALVTIRGKDLTVRYDNQIILTATINNDPSTFYLRQITEEKNSAVSQVFSLTASDGKKLSFTGFINGSDESFPCEAERKQSGTIVVRHTYGLSSSLLNRAVYDRKNDWVLSVDPSNETSDLKIAPVVSSINSNKFSLAINGNEIVFRFRPHYYQKHRGLNYFEPWNYKVWDKSIVGWCSWFAFRGAVTEQDIRETADVISQKMVPYGLDYLQIDDGYQQKMGAPEMWIKPNNKFPSGMDGLAKYISSKGLKPGIWTAVSFADKDFVMKNKTLFITDSVGNPVSDKYIMYALDGSNKEALDKITRPVYHSFRQMGWQYFKLDGLRHLRYEGYNSNTDYFNRKKTDRIEAFRKVAKAVRDEIGKDNFLLACWGIRPELIGIVDGCRIGNDGYGYESLTKYNSFNNIIWRNDPDHIVLNKKEAYRSCMATSLTGSLFMLTDKPEIYNTSIIEPALRSIPVLFTLPGQIFDVDPSGSDMIGHIDTDLSGSGARAADASRTSPYDLFLLEINKPFENWLVLGRAGERSSYISFADLGLPTGNEYLVFEFWSKKYLGSFTGGFELGRIDSWYNCQVFSIRKRVAHPQILATNRHITCGGLELQNVSWQYNILSGKSDIVANDAYTIYLTEPQGVKLKEFTCEGVKITGNKKEGMVRQITVISNSSMTIDWKAEYFE